MKKNLIIIVIVLVIIIGGIFYFSNTCNPPFIRGNISSSGEKIYHIPRGEFYYKTKIDRSVGERCFFSERQATSAGWRASFR